MGCVGAETTRALEELLVRYCSRAYSSYSSEIRVSAVICITPVQNCAAESKLLSLLQIDRKIKCEDAVSFGDTSLEGLPPSKRMRLQDVSIADTLSDIRDSPLTPISDLSTEDSLVSSGSTRTTSVTSLEEQGTPFRQGSPRVARRTSLVFKRNLGPRHPVKRCRLSTPCSKLEERTDQSADTTGSLDESTSSPQGSEEDLETTFIEKKETEDTSASSHIYENVSPVKTPPVTSPCPQTPSTGGGGRATDESTPSSNTRRTSPFRLRRSISPRRVSPLRIPARPKQVYHPRRQSAGLGAGTQQCATCKRYFSDEGKLRIHMRIHLGLRVFACQFCDFRFASKMELDAHQAWHTVSKDYVCKTCGGNFVTVAQLREHEELVHVFAAHAHAPPGQLPAEGGSDWVFQNPAEAFSHMQLPDGENIYEELNPTLTPDSEVTPTSTPTSEVAPTLTPTSEQRGFDFGDAVESIGHLSDIQFSDGIERFEAKNDLENDLEQKNFGAIGSERKRDNVTSTDVNKNAVTLNLCGAADMTGASFFCAGADEPKMSCDRPPPKSRKVKDMTNFFNKLG